MISKTDSNDGNVSINTVGIYRPEVLTGSFICCGDFSLTYSQDIIILYLKVKVNVLFIRDLPFWHILGAPKHPAGLCSVEINQFN